MQSFQKSVSGVGPSAAVSVSAVGLLRTPSGGWSVHGSLSLSAGLAASLTAILSAGLAASLTAILSTGLAASLTAILSTGLAASLIAILSAGAAAFPAGLVLSASVTVGSPRHFLSPRATPSG